jgi:hypothetical protein
MPEPIAEPYIPRHLDRQLALAVGATLESKDGAAEHLRELATAIVAALADQGASAAQIADAMEDAVAAVLAGRAPRGYRTADADTISPTTALAEQMRHVTSEALVSRGLLRRTTRSVMTS